MAQQGLKITRICGQWYRMTNPETGIYAGFRCFSRGCWGVYFRNADNSCAFGMKPGEELDACSRADAERIARGRLLQVRL